MEGPGYDSPEEAVTAYLEAMKKGDARGMLSTFAIETYVAEMDAQAYLERMWAFTPGDFRGARAPRQAFWGAPPQRPLIRFDFSRKAQYGFSKIPNFT